MGVASSHLRMGCFARPTRGRRSTEGGEATPSSLLDGRGLGQRGGDRVVRHWPSPTSLGQITKQQLVTVARDQPAHLYAMSYVRHHHSARQHT